MKNLTIRQIMVVLFIVPVLSTMISLIQEVPVALNTVSQARYFDEGFDVVDDIGSVIHELQAERGLSVGLVSATKDKEQLIARVKAQQEKVDVALVELDQSVRVIANQNWAKSRFEFLDKALVNIKRNMPSLRARMVGDKQPRSAEVVSFYSNIIDDLILTSRVLSVSTGDEAASNLKQAHEAIVIAKEYSGQQRAVGNGIVSSGRGDEVARERFVSVSALQDRFFAFFKLSASEEEIKQFEQMLPPQTVQAQQKAVEEMTLALREGRSPNMTQAEWWRLTTLRIDAMHQVEKRLTERLQALNHAIGSATTFSLYRMIGVQIGLLMIGLSIMFWVANSVVVPLRRAANALELTMRGASLVEMPAPMPKHTEIGQISNAVAKFVEASKEREALQRERDMARANQEKARSGLLVRMEQDFKEATSSATLSLTNASGTLREKAGMMLTTINSVKSAQDRAKDSALQSNARVNEVTRLSSELAQSISEIAEQSTRTAQLTQEVLGRAQSSGEAARNFEEVANAIASISDLIKGIASQTNLLALNATIEAARAGEAGRGFAVVAGEVKGLASRTMEATRTIEKKVAELKVIARIAAETSVALTQDVGTIEGLNAAIAAAVHEQHMTSESFATSIHDLAEGIGVISEQVNAIARLGTDAQHSAESVQNVSEEMKKTTSTFSVSLPKIIAETSERIARQA